MDLSQVSDAALIAELDRRSHVSGSVATVAAKSKPATSPPDAAFCRPLVISGPSGVGKGTLVNLLHSKFPGQFRNSISHTTRAPRGSETDGVHYHFTTVDEFEQDIEEGKFLEYARVHGNLYGTRSDAVDQIRMEFQVPVIEIDVQGASQLAKSGLKGEYVFVEPPSLTDLEHRLRGRGEDEERTIQVRLGNATREIEAARTSNVYNHIVVNRVVSDSFAELQRIVDENRLKCQLCRFPHLFKNIADGKQ